MRGIRQTHNGGVFAAPQGPCATAPPAGGSAGVLQAVHKRSSGAVHTVVRCAIARTHACDLACRPTSRLHYCNDATAMLPAGQVRASYVAAAALVARRCDALQRDMGGTLSGFQLQMYTLPLQSLARESDK